MRARRLASAVAAVLIGATATVAAPPAAQAKSGYCAKGTGVTVIVDRGALGGGTSIGCDPQGAKTAGSTVVPRAGFPLTYVQRQPGFVCRVAGAPASDPCANTPPTNAYWGLFWSDGKGGGWTYSSVGIGSLKVPAGGFIGWRWQSSNTRRSPGTAPSAPKAASPKPTRTTAPKPKPKPTSAPSRSTDPTSSASGSARADRSGAVKPGAPRSTATASAHASKSKVAKKTKKQKQEPKASKTPSSSSSGASGASSDPSPDDTTAETNLTAGEQADDGSPPALPLVAAGLVVAMVAAGGRLVWLRRKGA